MPEPRLPLSGPADIIDPPDLLPNLDASNVPYTNPTPTPTPGRTGPADIPQWDLGMGYQGGVQHTGPADAYPAPGTGTMAPIDRPWWAKLGTTLADRWLDEVPAGRLVDFLLDPRGNRINARADKLTSDPYADWLHDPGGADPLGHSRTGPADAIVDERIYNSNQVPITEEERQGPTDSPTIAAGRSPGFNFDRGSINGLVGSIGYGTSIPIASQDPNRGTILSSDLMFGNPPVNLQGQKYV